MDGWTGRAAADRGWYKDPSGRHEQRYWDGTVWTGNVADGGVLGDDPIQTPLPSASVTPVAVATPGAPRTASVQPAPLEIAARPRKPGRFLRRMLWSIYAIPATLLFLALGLTGLSSGGIVAVVDLLASLPLYVAIHLHIWDKRVLNGTVWKVYAFAFIAWQLTYSFVIGASEPNYGVETAFTALALQAPMIVALFLYAFRRWEDAPSAVGATVRCPACGAPARPGKRCPACGAAPESRASRLVPLLAALVVLGMCAIGLFTFAKWPRTPSGGIGNPLLALARYDVRAEPPATPSPTTALPYLSDQERERLQELLRSRDYDGLETTFAAMYADARENPSASRVFLQATEAFEAAEYGALLDAWVAHSAEHFAPRVARAQHREAQAWNARGTAWASETSSGQFGGMAEWYEAATTDADAALSLEPDLYPAFAVKIGQCNATGDTQGEDVLIGECLRRFPHDYDPYSRALWAKLPRWGGSYSEMEDIANKARVNNPRDPYFSILYGAIHADEADLLYDNGSYSAAIEAYTEALLFGLKSDWLVGRGMAYSTTRQWGLAESDLTRALELDPDNVSAHVTLATLHYRQGDVAAAQRDIDAAAAIDPDDEHLLRYRQWAPENLGWTPQ